MFKELAVRILPLSLLTTLRALKHSFSERRFDHSRLFSEVYDQNRWGAVGTVSGPGSEVSETEEIRTLLPTIVRKLAAESLLDAPCGDFQWISQVDLGACQYYGVDIVDRLITHNKERHGKRGRTFICADLTQDRLPEVDLILCRDCLIHMSFRDARAVLANFRRSGSRYLLITTDPSVTENRPIETGQYRSINLELPPFSMGQPLEQHRDRRSPKASEALIDPHKCLALYRLN